MEYNNLHFILSTGSSTNTESDPPKKNEIVILSDKENQFVIGDGTSSIAKLAENPFISQNEILNHIDILEYKGIIKTADELPQENNSNGDVYIVGPISTDPDDESKQAYYWYIYTIDETTGEEYWQEISNFSDIPNPDWNETNENSLAYVKNKPAIKTGTGELSIVEGLDTEATGNYAHAEGYRTQADGIAAHSQNERTLAHGRGSHAEGVYTYAYGDYQHAQGKFNAIDYSSTYAHIVGNGTGDDDRKNIHTLDWNGNAWFAGDVTIGADNKKVATEQDISTLDTKITTLDNTKVSEATHQAAITDINTKISGLEDANEIQNSTIDTLEGDLNKLKEDVSAAVFAKQIKLTLTYTDEKSDTFNLMYIEETQKEEE